MRRKQQMLKISHLSKTYGKSTVKAVDDFNLELNPGEIVAFLGHNGAGKSTTIKSVVGILPFEEGKIEICGYDLRLDPMKAKMNIGYVPDNHAVYERLTGREYINHVADLYNVSDVDVAQRTNDFAEKFSMTRFLDNQIKSYSHGMKQKITVMAALIHNPRLWVLDEPIMGLDPKSAYQVKEYMKEHARKGNTVFFSSHILDVVEKIADRVVIIKKGKLQGIYDVKELMREHGSLEEVFMNIYEDEEIA